MVLWGKNVVPKLVILHKFVKIIVGPIQIKLQQSVGHKHMFLIKKLLCCCSQTNCCFQEKFDLINVWSQNNVCS